ncbi:methyltransferase domain protein [Teladorsagia circumcincta]|uniref:Methyltransferase domain protein n=1 Tax=Teladorsagia circumcincta TaxID=45464 RepID=A0A2G9UUK9_TELCI|nr:methyltransferase domain protein [Teladorsagia circumcincta]
MILNSGRANSLKHRAVIHYGFEFDYSANAAFKPTHPIPDLVERLVDRIADDGLFNFRPDQIGCDMSQMLCEIAGAKGCMVVRADGLSLPFREGADAVLSIAVLHHMALLSRRQKLIREILRVLKVGGKACITVWSMDQSNSEYSKMRDNKDSNINTHHSDRLLIHDGKEFIQQDMLVPWRIDGTGETFLRYLLKSLELLPQD